MGTVEFLRFALKQFHERLLDSVQGLNREQLHFRPLGKGNHIAFILWHYVRTEDGVIHALLQKKTNLWNAEGWDKKFGMDPRAQGTGMSAEQAAAVRIPDLEEFLAYMRNTFQATEAYLETVREEDLDQVGDYPFLGKRCKAEMLGGIILSHGSSHLGEICYVRGLLGLKGSPI